MISGDLIDLPIPEILNMLGRRSGKLEVEGVPDLNRLTLHVGDGFLRGFFDGEEEIADWIRVRDRLLTVMDSFEGKFEFRPSPATHLLGELNMPIPRLLSIIAATVDESGAFRDYFANPETCFKTLAAPNLWLDTQLFMFLEAAKPFLERGATALDLAKSLHLDLAQVQNSLFKLRSVGKIAPVIPDPDSDPEDAAAKDSLQRCLT